MSRRRQLRVEPTDRPSPPEHIRRFRVGTWLTPAERRIGAATEEETTEIMVRAYRRWQRAGQAWRDANAPDE